MGMFDHSKTWRFVVAASPEDCRRAFVNVMTKSPGAKLRAVKWKVRQDAVVRGGDGARLPAIIATHDGRAGLAAFGTALFGARARSAEDVAIGSELAFVIEDQSATGVTTCSLFMGRVNTAMGFTGDAGYFRSYMNDVK